MRPLLAAGCLLTVGSCTILTGEPMYQVAQCKPDSFIVTKSTPANGATDVTLGAAIVVELSDYPESASLQPFGVVTLRSGPNSFDFQAKIDFVHKALVVIPRAPLAPRTEYSLELATDRAMLSMQSTIRCNLHDPDKMAEHISIVFSTGTTPGGGPNPVPAYTLAKDVQPLFLQCPTGSQCIVGQVCATCVDPDDSKTCTKLFPEVKCAKDSCTDGGCHDANIHETRNLDLTEGMSLASLLLKSEEVPSLRRVAPGDPAQSYLLRKLVGSPDIFEGRMPLSTDLPWDPAKIQLVSDWIEGGANP